MLTKNCMEVLLSTKLNLSDVSYIQAELKSTLSVLELISPNQPHAQEVTVQRSRISITVLSYILEDNSKKLHDIELFH